MSLEPLIWFSLSELVVPDSFILHDPGFDWDFCCGIRGVENLCPWSLSFGFLYQEWLYLINLSFMTPDSIGIFFADQVALRISFPEIRIWPSISKLFI